MVSHEETHTATFSGYRENKIEKLTIKTKPKISHLEILEHFSDNSTFKKEIIDYSEINDGSH